MNFYKNLRVRYVIALGSLAIAIFASNFFMQKMIVRQKNYGRVIAMAGDQVRLTNRILFFTYQMGHNISPKAYEAARQQVNRAIGLMGKQHKMLINGAPDHGLPRITTPLLKQYYFDPNFAVDPAVRRFLGYAKAIEKTPYKDFSINAAAYIYIETNGPHILETLLSAVVQEYERFARADIKKLQDRETLATGATLFLLLIEALFIFYPMDLKIQCAFRLIQEKNDHLAAERKRAERASRSKSSFLSTVSHELRTPLNAIIGFSECLQAGIYGPLASPQQTESIDNIHKSGTHLLSLVEDILDVSLTDTGKIVLHETDASIDDLVSPSIAMVNTQAQKSGISLTIVPYDPLLTLHVDERRIQQVLFNLLTNAIKFTPKGGSIQVGSSCLPDGCASLYVTDTGYGMSADEIQIARERFGRIEDVLTRQHDGAGLGLPLVIELMTCHDGKVLIESTKGQGTTVTVTFPSTRTVNKINMPVTSQAAFKDRKHATMDGSVPTYPNEIPQAQDALNSFL